MNNQLEYSTHTSDQHYYVLFDPRLLKFVKKFHIYGMNPTRDVFIRGWADNLENAERINSLSVDTLAKRFNLHPYRVEINIVRRHSAKLITDEPQLELF